jgi:hypothetical protein
VNGNVTTPSLVVHEGAGPERPVLDDGEREGQAAREDRAATRVHDQTRDASMQVASSFP